METSHDKDSIDGIENFLLLFADYIHVVPESQQCLRTLVAC